MTSNLMLNAFKSLLLAQNINHSMNSWFCMKVCSSLYELYLHDNLYILLAVFVQSYFQNEHVDKNICDIQARVPYSRLWWTSQVCLGQTLWMRSPAWARVPATPPPTSTPAPGVAAPTSTRPPSSDTRGTSAASQPPTPANSAAGSSRGEMCWRVTWRNAWASPMSALRPVSTTPWSPCPVLLTSPVWPPPWQQQLPCPLYPTDLRAYEEIKPNQHTTLSLKCAL